MEQYTKDSIKIFVIGMSKATAVVIFAVTVAFMFA